MLSYTACPCLFLSTLTPSKPFSQTMWCPSSQPSTTLKAHSLHLQNHFHCGIWRSRSLSVKMHSWLGLEWEELGGGGGISMLSSPTAAKEFIKPRQLPQFQTCALLEGSQVSCPWTDNDKGSNSGLGIRIFDLHCPIWMGMKNILSLWLREQTGIYASENIKNQEWKQ